MTLDTLFAKANISSWNEGVWFKGAILKAQLLTVPGDAAHIEFIERNFAPLMREHISDLTIRQAAPAPPRSEPRQTKYPALKAGAWRDALDGPDLLD